ncbi:hypothetical protein BCR39DRAFT_588274 [Naematelia encephala]|uniref:Fe2OG dioxygenase domain-containing protein n=1 Tax=Naematelia encephala TaxID=71784 RepID=A0A1Y2B3U4_9TREE|nr:hypothetical protein BCR39DRAFT_588274 [Naematelia encephala]
MGEHACLQDYFIPPALKELFSERQACSRRRGSDEEQWDERARALMCSDTSAEGRRTGKLFEELSRLLPGEKDPPRLPKQYRPTDADVLFRVRMSWLFYDGRVGVAKAEILKRARFLRSTLISRRDDKRTCAPGPSRRKSVAVKRSRIKVDKAENPVKEERSSSLSDLASTTATPSRSPPSTRLSSPETEDDDDDDDDDDCDEDFGRLKRKRRPVVKYEWDEHAPPKKKPNNKSKRKTAIVKSDGVKVHTANTESRSGKWHTVSYQRKLIDMLRIDHNPAVLVETVESLEPVNPAYSHDDSNSATVTRLTTSGHSNTTGKARAPNISVHTIKSKAARPACISACPEVVSASNIVAPRLPTDGVPSGTFCRVLRIIAGLPPACAMPRRKLEKKPLKRPPVWAESRQELCETLPYYRAFQSGLYMSGRVAYGYLLEAFPAPRDTWAQDGRVIISHGGGQCILIDGEAVLAADQSPSDARVDTLLAAAQNKAPIILIAGTGYALLPWSLDCAYAILGWYWISATWVEAEPVALGVRPMHGRDWFNRYKIRFDWVQGQGDPWWLDTEVDRVPDGRCLGKSEREERVEPSGEALSDHISVAEVTTSRIKSGPMKLETILNPDPISGLLTPPITPPDKQTLVEPRSSWPILDGSPRKPDRGATSQNQLQMISGGSDTQGIFPPPGRDCPSRIVIGEKGEDLEPDRNSHAREVTLADVINDRLDLDDTGSDADAKDIESDSEYDETETGTVELTTDEEDHEGSSRIATPFSNTDENSPSAQERASPSQESLTARSLIGWPGSGLLRSQIERIDCSLDHIAPFAHLERVCAYCTRRSSRIYIEGWICLSPTCPAFWLLQTKLGLIPIPPGFNLRYHPEWLECAETPRGVRKPYDVVPTSPGVGEGTVGDRSLWKGWVCDQCGRANCRYRWEVWECRNCGTQFGPLKSAPPCSSTSLQPKIPPILGDGVVLDSSGITVTVSVLVGAQVVRYHLPESGSIYHIMPHNTAFADDLFQAYQVEAADSPVPLFQRRALKANTVKGQLLAQHFAVNSGASYKYIVDTLSLPFEESPACIRRALEVIQRNARQVLGQEVGFNEVLSVLYREGQKMSWHDDGENGLGPVVGSLSLGSSAIMSFRPKPPRQEHNIKFRLGQDSTATKRTSKPATALSITLSHGDLVVMSGREIQKRWSHRVIPLGFRIAATARMIGGDK